MKNNNKTREQLLKELEKSNAKITELEKSEVGHRKAEEALKEYKEKYKGIIWNAASCIVVYKPVDNGQDFVFVDFNPMAEKVEKILKEKVIGRKVTEVFPGVIEFGLYKVFQNVWKTGEPEHFPVSIYKDNRIQGYRENYVYKLRSGEIVAVYQDLTEAKQVEETLRESEEQYRSLFEKSRDVIYLLTADGELLDINSAGEKLLGYSRDEMIGNNVILFYANSNDVQKFNKEIIKNGHVQDFETKLHCKDGRVLDCIITASIRKTNKGQSLYQGIIRDVTEKKKAEEELEKHRDHLEELVKERTIELKNTQEELIRKEQLAILGQFSGSISHELRNPLAVIDSSIYYLKMKLKESDKTVHQHLERIGSSVNSSTTIIDSLLSLTRMKKPEMSRNNLISLVSDSITNTKIPAKVKVIQDFPDKEILVNIEYEQCRMALKNIINNACEAMDNNGTLTVTIRKIKKNSVEVSFKDTGYGIAPENIDKIFLPLFSTKTRGIGFGLSITKMIIDNHGGTLKVKSEPGKGADFIISLPLL